MRPDATAEELLKKLQTSPYMLSAWNSQHALAPPKCDTIAGDARPEEEPARCRARPQGRQASVGDHDRRRAQRPRKEGGAGAVDKSPQTGIGLSTEEYEEEREAPWSYPRESTSSTELFRRPA